MSAGATSERRKGFRLDSKKVFSHYRVDIHYYTEETNAELMNISEKGIGLFLRRDILVDVDQSFLLEILNLSTHYVITAKARLAWRRRSTNPKEPGYMFGCEFEEPIELPDDIIAINFSLESDD
jgi:c-di-GMP-binding flagellar brake protein YcgR